MCALAAGFALALAACGDDDTTTGGSAAKPLTKQEFVARGNAACKKANDRADDLERPSSNDELGEFAQKTRDISAEARDSLRELTPPAANAEQFKTALGSLDEAIKDLEGIKQAAADGDDDRVKQLAQEVSDSPFEEQAVKAGLTACEG